MAKEKIPIYAKIIIGILIIAILFGFGMIIYTITIQFTGFSGEECKAWINGETLMTEHDCPESYECEESRWGTRRVSDLAMGNSKENPAIGECVRKSFR